MHRLKILDRRSSLLTLFAINLAIAALLTGTVWLVARASHQAYAERARETSAHLVAIAQSNIAAEFARVDVSMRAALRELERHSTGQAGEEAGFNSTLDAHRRLQPAIEGLRLTDETGRVRWGNDLPADSPAEVPLSQYFARMPEQQDGPPLFLGPVVSRVSGHGVVAVVRQFHAGGRFRGLLYATVSLDHFERLFSGFDLARHDALTLRTSPHLQLLVRHAAGSQVAAPGSTHVSPEFASAFAANAAQGSFVSETALDGIERTNAYRSVEGWPLVVVVGLDNERFYAPWRTQTRRISLLAMAAWLLVAAATAAIHRIQSRRTETLRALSAETRRMQALLQVTTDGIHILDRTGHLVALSHSFARMLGTQAEDLVGRHVSTWDATQNKEQLVDWFSRARDGDVSRNEIKHRRADGQVIDVELQLAVANIDGELLVFASTRDITEKRQLLASAEAASARIRDLYDQAPCGYFSLDENGVLVHANKTLLQWLGLPEHEVIGKARLVDFLDGEGQEDFARNFPRLKAGQMLESTELHLTHPGSLPRYVRVSVAAVFDGEGRFLMSRSVALDITAQHEAQERAKRLLSDQAAMLDNDIVGMVKLRNRVAVWRNRALEHMFGYELGELESQSSRMLYPDDASFVALGQQAYPVLHAGLNFRTQLQMRHKDGHLLWIDLSGVKLSGELTFWMMVDITAMKESQANIEHIAFHDALTQLPNRLLLHDRLSQALTSAERTGTHVAICYLDLDGFKSVNDEHGHDAGDDLLREVARRLASTVRANDTAARLGGDEFVLVLTMLQTTDEWKSILDRSLAAIRMPVHLKNGVEAKLDTSVGVALAPIDSGDPQTLLELADHAMLRAKRAGKGVVELARRRPSN